MILEKRPITLAEVKEYSKGFEEENKVLSSYLKSFAKLSKSDAQKLSQEIKAMDNVKIKGEDIVKIVDLMPEDSEDVNKIFHDINLTEEESNAILSIVKKY